MKRLVSRRSLIGGLIVAFWLVMTGWLVHREGLWPRAQPASSARNATPPSQTQPMDTWMGLFLGEARVGTLHWRQGPETREGGPGLRLYVRSSMALDVLGKPTNLAIEGTAWHPDRATAAQFRFAVQADDHALALSGALIDGMLEAEIESAGEPCGGAGPWKVLGPSRVASARRLPCPRSTWASTFGWPASIP